MFILTNIRALTVTHQPAYTPILCLCVSAHEEDEDLMMSWFQLVNEKNELVRTENDYIYM